MNDGYIARRHRTQSNPSKAMDEAHSTFLLQVDALSGHCDQLARGAHLNEAALASLAATLRAAREITLALDGA